MKTNKYEFFIISLLSEKPYYGGIELNDLLAKRFKINIEAAKKNIQRAVIRGLINSSSPLTFGKGQYIYFSKEKTLNKEIFYPAAKENRPPLFRLMWQLDANGGILSYYDALKLASSPLEKSSTKVKSLNQLIGELKSMRLVERITDKRGVDYLIDPLKIDDRDILMEEEYSKMLVDTIFLFDIIGFIRKQNIIDNENSIYRNRKSPEKGAEHNNIIWDAYAYSKTTGINTVLASNFQSNNKNTLVVLDVVVSRQYTQIDLQGFIDRIQIVRNSTKSETRKILPIIVFKDISDEAWAKSQGFGLLTISLGAVFGEKIFEIIQQLHLFKLEEIKNFSDPEELAREIDEIISKIKEGGQQINLSNVIGDLFESLMHQLLRVIYSNATIEQGLKLKDTSREGNNFYEYDFVIKPTDEIVIIETKGFKPSDKIKLGSQDEKNTLNWFFDGTFPFAMQHFKGKSSLPIRACYLTTAKFEDDALEKVKALNAGKLKPNKMNLFYDGMALLQLVREHRLDYLKKALEKNFYK